MLKLSFKFVKYLVRSLILLFLVTDVAYAVSTSDVNDNLKGLVTQINQINSDINNKQKQQQHLSKAIDDSNQAINQSEGLLNHLQQQRNMDLRELEQIESVLPQLTQATESAQTNVKVAINNIYKQIRLLETNDNSSIFSSNDNVQYERKKKYLIKLLQVEQQRYVELQDKLSKLQALNDKINNELDRIDKQLGITTQRKSQLQQEKQAKLDQKARLQQSISKEKMQLANLKEQQAQLNRLLQNLQALEQQNKTNQSKQQQNKTNQSKQQQNSRQIANNNSKQSYEDNSPFLSRKLSKPVENGTVLVGFGAVRGGVPNNGLLFSANNSPIHSISNGKVLFSGTLPGFGQMLVVDNGDNYVSIYGGILPKVAKNQQLTSNQIIGSSGTSSNQPMGGVYFELRHFGKPVNPSKLAE